MMNEKENARPDAATSRQAMDGEQLTLCGFSSSPGPDSNTDPRDGQGVLDWLGVGARNAVPLQKLAEWTGMDGRTLAKEIQGLRRKGKPICSRSTNPAGYYLAETEKEIRDFCDGMRRRSDEILETASAVEEAAGLGGERDA